MVKKAKDYVDYANQIQVTSGFGYNTAIAKSKETQAQWSKTLDNLSDSLMKGAMSVESAKQKRLSEQLEFDVDEKEITDEDGNKYVQKTYNKIKEPLFLFNRNQEAYDKTVFMELQNNVMADAREITSRIQADVLRKNQNPQQYIGRSSVMLDELVKNLPSKFTKVLEPDLQNLQTQNERTVAANYNNFIDKKKTYEGNKQIDELFTEIQDYGINGLYNNMDEKINMLRDVIETYSLVSDDIAIKGQDVIESAIKHGKFYRTFSDYLSSPNDTENTAQGNMILLNNLNEIKKLLIGVGNPKVELVAGDGNKISITKQGFFDSLGGLDASDRGELESTINKRITYLASETTEQTTLYSFLEHEDNYSLNKSSFLDSTDLREFDDNQELRNRLFPEGFQYDIAQDTVKFLKRFGTVTPRMKKQFKDDLEFGNPRVIPVIETIVTGMFETQMSYKNNGKYTFPSIARAATMFDLDLNDTEKEKLRFIVNRSYITGQVSEEHFLAYDRRKATPISELGQKSDQSVKEIEEEIQKGITAYLTDISGDAIHDAYFFDLIEQIVTDDLRIKNNPQEEKITSEYVASYTAERLAHLMNGAYGTTTMGYSESVMTTDAFFDATEDVYAIFPPEISYGLTNEDGSKNTEYLQPDILKLLKEQAPQEFDDYKKFIASKNMKINFDNKKNGIVLIPREKLGANMTLVQFPTYLLGYDKGGRIEIFNNLAGEMLIFKPKEIYDTLNGLYKRYGQQHEMLKENLKYEISKEHMQKKSNLKNHKEKIERLAKQIDEDKYFEELRRRKKETQRLINEN